jgi:unsaturated rhamnogalacturonyl hydrolase
MKKSIAILFLMIAFITAKSQVADSTEYIVRKVADRILADANFLFEGVYNNETYTSTKEIPDTVTVKFKSQYCAWQYTNGVLNLAMLNLGKFLNEQKYTNYTVKHINFGFDNYQWFQQRFKNNRPYTQYPFGELFTMDELDDFGAMGASIIEANQFIKSDVYKNYYQKATNHLLNKRLRMQDGTWIRKFPEVNTLWADDLYMGISLLSRMGKYTANNSCFNDAIRQVENFTKYLFNNNKELYYHCYYTTTRRNGIAFWGRCNGWIMLAKVHLLNALPVNHPKRNQLIKNLQQQIFGIVKYQNGNGLWHQLLDKPDSYEESSCTAMFIYSIAAAINNNWLQKKYAGAALNGWNGLVKNMLTPDGKLKSICIGTGIEDNTFFYYNRPARVNDKHGTGAFLDAGVEVIKLKKLLAANK